MADHLLGYGGQIHRRAIARRLGYPVRPLRHEIAIAAVRVTRGALSSRRAGEVPGNRATRSRP